MEDAQSPQKKRNQKSTSPSSDENKKRGRPRLTKQDESAVDRRRTQIRVAQRAYRQRKESTLEELRQRLSHANNTIELMNKAFTDCRDSLIKSGLADAQARTLHEASKTYESFMRGARNPEPDGSDGSPRQDDAAHDATSPKCVPDWMDQLALNRTAEQTPPEVVGMGYSLVTQGQDDVPSQMPFIGSISLLQEPISSQIPLTLQPPVNIPHAQETTFARWFHRYCLERAYLLLLDPAGNPDAIKRAFSLSMIGRDRPTLLKSLRFILSQESPELLYDSDAPKVHVGGAGTHYARRDRFGNLEPKKTSLDLGSVSPQVWSLLQSTARGHLDHDITVEVVGFEGQWLDPYDVEGYLAEKGILISPASSFADATVMVMAPSPASAGSSATSPTPVTTPPDWPAPLTHEELRALDTYQPDEEWSQIPPLLPIESWLADFQQDQASKQHLAVDVDMAEAVGNEPGIGEPPQDIEVNGDLFDWEDEATSWVQRGPAKTTFLDVARFIKGKSPNPTSRKRDTNILQH